MRVSYRLIWFQFLKLKRLTSQRAMVEKGYVVITVNS